MDKPGVKPPCGHFPAEAKGEGAAPGEQGKEPLLPKACMVTGHRALAPQKDGEIRFALRQELFRAIDQGYTHFLSGFAQGVDLLFAELVVQMKERFPYVTLEAALPHPQRLRCPDPRFQELLAACDVLGVHSPAYGPQCFMKRNRYMVSRAQRVIGLYDGRPGGGTAATLRYAARQGKEIVTISL